MRQSAQRTESAIDEIAAAAERGLDTVSDSTERAGEETEGLGESTERTQKKFKGFGEELDEVNRLLEKDKKNTELLAQKKEVLKKAVSETAGKLSDLKSKQEAVNRAYQSGEIPDEEYREFQREIIATEQELADYEEQLRHVDDAARDAAETSEGKLSGAFGAVAAGAGAAVAAVGAAAVALGTAAVTSADDLDKAVNHVLAATGKGAEEAGRFEEIIKGVYGNNYGESFEDIANSVSLIQQNLGELDDESLQKVTESAYALQDVFEMDVAESSRAAKAMSENFGIAAADAYDYIAKGAQNGLNYSGELIDSINEYSVQFAKLGFSADDMFTVFAKGAENGAWNLDKIGDAVKEFSIRAIDGSETTRAGFEAIGYDAQDMANKFGEGGDVARDAFQTVVRALSEMEDPIERDAAGVALFGTMWEDLGADAVASLADITDSAYDCAGAMDTIKEVKYSSLSDALSGLKRQVELLVQPLGEELIPVVSEVVDRLSEMAEDGIPPLIDAAGGLIDGLIPMIDPLLSLGSEILPALMEVVVPLFGALSEIAQTVLPLFTEFLSGDFLPLISELLSMLMDTLLPVITQVLNELLPPIFDVLSALMPVLQTLLDIAMPLLDLVMALLDPILKLVSTAIAPLIEQLLGLINDILTPLMPLIQALAEEITEQFGTALNFVCDLLGTVMEYITNVFGNIRKVIGGLIDFITGVFTGDWEKAWNGVAKIFEGVWNNIKAVAELVVNAVIDLVNGFISGINSMFGWLGANIEPLRHVDWTADNAEEQAIAAIDAVNKNDRQSTAGSGAVSTAGSWRNVEYAAQAGYDSKGKKLETSAFQDAPTVTTTASPTYTYKPYTPTAQTSAAGSSTGSAAKTTETAKTAGSSAAKSSSSSGVSSGSGSTSGSSGNFISITSYTPTVWDDAATSNEKLSALLGTGLVGNSKTAKAITSLSSGGASFNTDSSSCAAKAAESSEKTLGDVVKALNKLQKTVEGIEFSPSFEMKARDLSIGKVAVKDINDIAKKNGKSPFIF